VSATARDEGVRHPADRSSLSGPWGEQPFLRQLHVRLAPDAHVFMADNVFVVGHDGALLTRPGSDDAHKRRTLNDGTTYGIVNNHFTEGELRPHGPAQIARDGSHENP